MAALGTGQAEEEKDHTANLAKKNSNDSHMIDASRSSQGAGYGFFGKVVGRIVGGIQNQFGVSGKNSAPATSN